MYKTLNAYSYKCTLVTLCNKHLKTIFPRMKSLKTHIKAVPRII